VSAVGDGWRLAVGTLTVLRLRPPSRVDRPVAGAAMALAGLAALPLAAATAAISLLGQAAHAPSLLTAALAVAVLALGSRGLHLDGLADTADGLASSYDRERALRVMRTGDVGPAGAATLVLNLLVQVGALAGLLDQSGRRAAWLVLGVVIVSRAMLSIACAAGVPAARADGLGSAVAGSVPRPVTAVVVALAAAAMVGVEAAAGCPWWAGVVVVAAAVGGCTAVLARCRSRLGGVTGDVLGAVVEVSLAAALMAAAVAAVPG